MYSLAFISSAAFSWLVSSSTCTVSSESPPSLNTSLNTLTIATFVFIASFPPLRITAFPLFRQSPKASAATLGRDSNIIATTPNGTLFC